MPELDIADAEGTLRGDTILVSVAPPEGVAVASALREGGYVVTEAPLHLLAVRALAEIPRVMVVDVDVPGAMEAIERAREVAPAELVCVGDATRAAELGATLADGRAFTRPIDLEALVMCVLTVAEPSGPPRSRGTLPPSLARPRETSPPRRADSEVPPSEYPSTSDPLDVAVLLPTLDEAEGTAILAPLELSPELSHILEAAEQRVSALGQPHPSSIPSPEEELDLLLPPDLLASLDEPLDPDDEGSASGASTGGTGFPKPRTSGETGATGATTTGAFVDRGTSAVEATRTARASAHPTIAGMVSVPESTPLFGPPTAPPSREAEPPPPLGASPAQAPSPPEPRAPRIGVVPIPVEPMPDRPVPIKETSRPAPQAEPPRPLAQPLTLGEAPRPPAQPLTLGELAGAVAPPSSIPAGAGASAGSVPPPRYPTAPAPPPYAVEARAELRPSVQIPAVLGDGDAVRALSAAIAGRASGSLALGPDATTRRIVLHEGDIVTAASGSADETLIAFLAARGDLARDVAARLHSKLPAHGRHAGAALIAHGHLGQDDLWPVLRAHAEWIIGRALLCDEGTCEVEAEPPGRLKAEPSVFGGAAGAEVLLEEIRRVIPPADALRRLGGPTARLAEGPRRQLLLECALRPEDDRIVRAAAGRSVGEVLAESEPELADVLYGLVSLGVLEALAPTAPAEAPPSAFDPLDEEALRRRVRARVALVEDGDYFSLLGVAPSATGYEIRRAYLELRRAFEPGRVLTAATADLADDVRLVIEVLDEAYEILREPHRRERYRRALEAGPP